MPPARPARQRVANNENDENIGSQRLTRAAAAKLSIDDLDKVANVQKPLQTKKSSTTAQPARKRAALGDVSNVAKGEGLDAKGGKKTVGTKSALVSKASQSVGVTKQPRAASRNALATKDKNKSSTITRPASGSGLGGPVKRKAKSSTVAVKEETPIEDDEDEEPARKKVHTGKSERHAKVEDNAPAKVLEEETSDAEEEVEEVDVAEPVEDLDKDDHEDPLMAAEYVVEIFEYLKKLEIATAPNPEYMEHQADLEWKMRGILVDWLIEVHTRFHLLPETLFLTVNIIDRFLSEKVVNLDRLQLVGVTAMFIASKYEEVMSPHVANFRHVADDGFTEEEILSAERFLLSALDYDLSYPNPMNFLRRISKADDYDIQTRTIGKYLMEISLLDHRFMGYMPSHVAAAAMFLSRQILGKAGWDATLAHYSGYTEEEIAPVFKLMIDYLARAPPHEAFFRKYASKKFMKASILARSWAKKYAVSHGIVLSDTYNVAGQ